EPGTAQEEAPQEKPEDDDARTDAHGEVRRGGLLHGLEVLFGPEVTARHVFEADQAAVDTRQVGGDGLLLPDLGLGLADLLGEPDVLLGGGRRVFGLGDVELGLFDLEPVDVGAVVDVYAGDHRLLVGRPVGRFVGLGGR